MISIYWPIAGGARRPMMPRARPNFDTGDPCACETHHAKGWTAAGTRVVDARAERQEALAAADHFVHVFWSG
jgi:hypothetical protein